MQKDIPKMVQKRSETITKRQRTAEECRIGKAAQCVYEIALGVTNCQACEMPIRMQNWWTRLGRTVFAPLCTATLRTLTGGH